MFLLYMFVIMMVDRVERLELVVDDSELIIRIKNSVMKMGER